MFEFLEYLASGQLTPGEVELAYNLTVIYGMSVLCMVVCYTLLSRPTAAPAPDQADLPDPAATLALLRARRTVTPKDLSGSRLGRAEVEQLLEAANWAPSHNKTEPWRFTVLDGEAVQGYLDTLEDWYEQHREEVDPQDWDKLQAKLTGARATWAQNVSHAFIIGMKRQALPDKRLPEWEEICAVACAVQNMHLQATALGCTGFWSSHTWCRAWRDSAECRQFCHLTDNEDRVLGAFLVGRVQQGKQIKGSRRSWQDKVQWKTEASE